MQSTSCNPKDRRFEKVSLRVTVQHMLEDSLFICLYLKQLLDI